MNDTSVSRTTALDPAIRREIAGTTPMRQRRIAIAVASLAIRELPDRPVELDVALARAEASVSEPTARELVAALAARLDDEYLEMYDDEKPGGRTAGWETAFRVARAAASLQSALEDDPAEAAAEAAYEALFALDRNETALLETVLGTP